MRTTTDVFHLAIPVHNLDAAQHFYVDLLCCNLARSYPDRITLDSFGDRLVCYLTEGAPRKKRASLYPRHFGVTFQAAADFELLHACAALRQISFFHDVSTRFERMAEEH